ncbi:cobalt ABC transporter permease [Ruegeria atlantica]|uniref:cobalt ABC transporter permease n=1 Tax=Ruegeria atlantica TaxID=81569 RepID=UPI00147E60A4|nr:cobalt ABC transporter permease [Ruegeria atlantica]
MKHLVVILAVCCAPVPALAHKVIAGVFESGDVIEGEIGFSNGDMASGTEVIVTGPDGAELGRSVTDADGFFVYTPTSAVAHTFFADLGAGHVAEVTMSAEDVARVMGVAVAETGDSSSAALTPASGSAASLSVEEQQVIAKAVRDELRPLRREIAAYREQNDLQTILGGIGYIVGLFGLGFYMAARRKLAS